MKKINKDYLKYLPKALTPPVAYTIRVPSELMKQARSTAFDLNTSTAQIILAALRMYCEQHLQKK